MDKENHKRPTDLFEEGLDVEGKAIFGFKTPGKKGGMAEYAANTPKSHLTEARTPKSSRKSIGHLKTPTSSRNLMHSLNKDSPARSFVGIEATPRADRERNKRSMF